MSDFLFHDAAGRPVLAQAARNRIKHAAKELRRLAGLKIEEMAVRAGVSKSQWHNYESLTAPDLIPLHVALALELDLGEAPVSRALAALNGLAVASEAQVRHRAKIADLMGRAAREQGEALATLIEVGADGAITPNEAKRLESEWSDVAHVAEEVRTVAAQIIAGDEA